MPDSITSTKVPVDLLRKYDRPGPRYTSYPTAPVWGEDVGVEEYRQALSTASQSPDQPTALYCHIPFCRKRCYYCGCNTSVVKRQASVDAYLDSLVKEIERAASHLEKRNKISQLHFGGGTPTFIGVSGLGRILDRIDTLFHPTGACEKSIEVDPRVTTVEQLDFLAGRGLNRVSLGVQDFDPDVQDAVGRIQSFEQVEKILNHCRTLQFKGVNFDLIYGLPRQTLERFNRTLELTLQLRPDRLAIYSFAFLPSLKANQAKINPEELPPTELKYELFAAAVERLTAAGYRQIGMDHFALPEDELSLAQTDGRLHRNFMGYTVQSAPEMIGLGMSAISYVADSFFQNVSKVDSYKRSVSEHGLAVYRGKKLSDDDLVRQYVIASLMCNFRLDYARFQERFGITYGDYFASEHKSLDAFVDDRLVLIEKDGVRVTPLGRTFVRNIAMLFDAYLTADRKSTAGTFSRTI